MNVMQMLVNHTSNSTEHGGAALLSEQNLPVPEQPFNQVLAQLVVPSQSSSPVMGQEEELILDLQEQLSVLLAVLDGGNIEADLLVNSAVPGLNSSDSSALGDVEPEQLAELTSYLENFSLAMEQENLSVDELYSIFVAIPQLPLENTTQVGHSEPRAGGTALSANQIVQQEEQHWGRWSMLVQQLQQASQGNSLNSGVEQVLRELATLVNKWNNHPEWVSLLQQKMGQKLGTPMELELAQSSTKQKPIFTSYLPLSLLNQGKQAGSAERNYSPYQVHSRVVTNNEAQAPTNQLNSLAVGGEAREITVEGTDRLIGSTKPNESTALPHARMSHLLDDMQGIFRNQLSVLKDGEHTQLRVRLTPEHLGHLDIRITSENGKMIAQIMTSTKLAKDALELQLHQLRATLVQQGIQIEKMEVTQQTNSHSLLHQEQRGAQHFQQQKGKQHAEKQEKYVETEEVELNEDQLFGQVSQVNYAV